MQLPHVFLKNTTKAESSRKQFGLSLRYYREQRRLNEARVADMTKVNAATVKAWENGDLVPQGQQWELLRKLVHRDLSKLAPLRLEALKELEELARETSQALLKAKQEATTKPSIPQPITVEDNHMSPVKLVVDNAVSPRRILVETKAIEPVKTEPVLKGPGFDVSAAYAGHAKLPVGWRGTAEVERRKAFAMNLLMSVKDISNEDLKERVRQAFNGVSVSNSSVSKLRVECRKQKAKPFMTVVFPEMGRKADEIAGVVKVVNEAKATPFSNPYTVAMPIIEAPAAPIKPVEVNPNADIETAAQLVLGAIPNLKSFTITVAENGEVTVDHTVREVKVVETTGTFKLKR